MSRVAALLLLAAALLGTVMLELWPGHEDGPAATGLPVRPVPVIADGQRAAAGFPRDALAAILARPLFSPDRRPASAAPASVEALPRLTGIIIEKERRMALFAAAEGGKPLVLNEEGQVAGFVVRQIEPGRVTLVGPRGALSLVPSFDPAPPSAPAPPGPAGMGPGMAPGVSPGPGAFPNLVPSRPVAR